MNKSERRTAGRLLVSGAPEAALAIAWGATVREFAQECRCPMRVLASRGDHLPSCRLRPAPAAVEAAR